VALKELLVKYVEEGQNCGFDFPTREFSTNSLLVGRVLGAYFESRVKLLGPLFVIPKTVRKL
jgi:hypothetical protein